MSEPGGVLVCSTCHLPHEVGEVYRQRYADKAHEYGVSVDEIWECGWCFRAGLSIMSNIRVECEALHKKADA